MKRMFRLIVLMLIFGFCLVITAQAESLTAEECAKLVWDTIESEYPDLFEPVSIDYSEKRLIVYVEKTGLASELQTAYTDGYGQNYPSWVEYKKNFLSAYRAIQTKIEETSNGNMILELWLYNDDLRAFKRSIFIKYLAAASNGDEFSHDVMWRSDERIVRTITIYNGTCDISSLSTEELIVLRDAINAAIESSILE